MRLAELAIASGSTLSDLAVRLRVDTRWLAQVSAGERAMPRAVAASAALVLGVTVGDVLACCPLTTELTVPVLTRPLPARLGQLLPPLAVATVNTTGVDPFGGVYVDRSDSDEYVDRNDLDPYEARE